jgi:hypothetical protein
LASLNEAQVTEAVHTLKACDALQDVAVTCEIRHVEIPCALLNRLPETLCYAA